MKGRLDIIISIDPPPLTITKERIYGLSDEDAKSIEAAVMLHAAAYARELLSLRGIKVDFNW